MIIEGEVVEEEKKAELPPFKTSGIILQIYYNLVYK